jgi:hypothetical protein
MSATMCGSGTISSRERYTTRALMTTTIMVGNEPMGCAIDLILPSESDTERHTWRNGNHIIAEKDPFSHRVPIHNQSSDG